MFSAFLSSLILVWFYFFATQLLVDQREESETIDHRRRISYWTNWVDEETTSNVQHEEAWTLRLLSEMW